MTAPLTAAHDLTARVRTAAELPRELSEYRLHVRVVGGNCAPLADVAGGTRQDHVVFGRQAATGCGQQVIQMEHLTVSVEELKDAAARHFGPCGPKPTVATNPLVALGDGVTDSAGHIPGVGHSNHLSWMGRARGCNTPDDERDGLYVAVTP